MYVHQLLVELQSDWKNIKRLNRSNFMINSSEPMKKKHTSSEHQFVDPDESFNESSLFIEPSVSQKCHELYKYVKMAIDGRFKIPYPLPFWQHHQEKLPNLAKLAKRPFSIPVKSTNVER